MAPLGSMRREYMRRTIVAKRHKTTQRALANTSLKQVRLALAGIYG